MTIREFTLYTGYVPESEEEFAQIERDRHVFNAPVKVFCECWINAYYATKVSQNKQKVHELVQKIALQPSMLEPIKSEIEAIKIMLANMRRAYIASI